MNKLEKNENYNNKTFEDIKHIDENGIEFWYARELMNCLNYSKWSNFKKVISKAMESCKNSDISVFDHFADVVKMVQIGSETQREQQDYQLTRYACYLIATKCNKMEILEKRLLLLHKLILQYKLENRKLAKKNIAN